MNMENLLTVFHKFCNNLCQPLLPKVVDFMPNYLEIENSLIGNRETLFSNWK